MKSKNNNERGGALIQLLNAFRVNMNESLRKEITEKGTNNALIDNIIVYASSFEKANIIQESYKSSTKEITLEVRNSFSSIYDEIIGICRKASSYYHYEPLKAEQFQFQKVLRNLGHQRKHPWKPTLNGEDLKSCLFNADRILCLNTQHHNISEVLKDE